MKRGPGRPPLGDNTRSSLIQVRVTPKEKQLIDNVAKRDGVDVSYLIRRLLSNHIKEL